MKKTPIITSIILTCASLSLFISNPWKSYGEELITVKEVTPFTYCCIHNKGAATEIQNVIGKLWQAMQNQGIFPMGPMIGIYYNSPDTGKPEDFEWEIGFPISVQNRVLAPLEKKQWTYTKVASALHVGPYHETGRTMERIFDWIKDHDYIPAGPSVERYLDQDPSRVKPEELRTEIWIPCKKIKE